MNIRKAPAIALIAALILFGATTGNLQWSQLRSDNRRGSTAGAIGQSACGSTTLNHLASFDSTGCLVDGGAPPAAQLHVINFGLDGGGAVIPTGDIGFYPTANFSCTINKAMISADAASSVTVDIWKAAGAIPTSANKISASAPVTLSSAQINQNSALTSWTTSVSTGDVFGFSVATASTATKITGQIWCQ